MNCFDFNKTLNVIATGSTDHHVRLWNPYVESKPTAILKGHQTSILDVVINDSTGQLFSYSMDLFLKVEWSQNPHCQNQISSIILVSPFLALTSILVLFFNVFHIIPFRWHHF